MKNQPGTPSDKEIIIQMHAADVEREHDSRIHKIVIYVLTHLFPTKQGVQRIFGTKNKHHDQKNKKVN